jgi:hypothetical protein
MGWVVVPAMSDPYLMDQVTQSDDHVSEVEERAGSARRGDNALSSLSHMIVYPLWHIHHKTEGEGGGVRHCDESGEITIDERAGDDVKLLGIYSSRASADERIRRARRLPGFRDEPECFVTGEYELDQDTWTEGFVAVAG